MDWVEMMAAVESKGDPGTAAAGTGVDGSVPNHGVMMLDPARGEEEEFRLFFSVEMDGRGPSWL